MQGRIKDVISLLRKFSSSKINASEIVNDEVQAFWEERHKIERLSDTLNTSLYLGLNVESDLQYYTREENFIKQSSRMQLDDRN
jgi:hypothetical protein